MASFSDTIVAPITALSGAVAVLRVSGPLAYDVADALFLTWPAHPTPRHAIYGRFVNGDDGLALPFADGHSYTGELSVELSCHGCPASVRSLIEAALGAGARLAAPGEFTQRAFLNGGIDLTQAEGVRDTVAAATDAQLRMAVLHREGALSREIGAIRETLLGLLTAIEASTDFSEEIGDLDRIAAAERVESAMAATLTLLETAGTGRILRQGVRIAIVGRPNAGKSSLLNALLRTDRAIVDANPGTTRDFVEEHADLDGLPAVLIDTAGIRQSDDPVEIEGVRRTREIASNADAVWYVFDAATGWIEEDDRELSSIDRPTQIVANKADLPCAPCRGTSVSSVTRLGLPTLIADLKESLEMRESCGIAVSPRVAAELATVSEALAQARLTLEREFPDDLLCVHVREAIHALGTITGETASPDVIERIFHDFCVGK